jgi:glyoxylase-like metal-dependent hydrolase (beta-lactamase superfamily II)
MADGSRLYFKQLLAGLDVAEGDRMAEQMVNFVYLIGDRETGEAVAVDLAYDVPGILDLLEADGMRLTGTLATHYHPDHVGGSLMGNPIAGIAELLERTDVPVHVNDEEVEWVTKATGVSAEHLVGHASGDTVTVGEIPITLIHTPGHTPGSQCFLVEGKLLGGDTLFLDGCGRTDLPGSDASLMFDSLQRLAELPAGTVVYPGHRYSLPSSATMSSIREQNYVYQPQSKDQWMTMFGR